MLVIILIIVFFVLYNKAKPKTKSTINFIILTRIIKMMSKWKRSR